MSSPSNFQKIHDDFYRANRKTLEKNIKSPLSVVKRFANTHTNPCYALDIGAGIGYNTQHLLQKGYSVEAVDFSEASIEMIKETTPPSLKKKLTLKRGDIFSITTRAKYDLIVCTFVFQYLSKLDQVRLIDLVKSKTVPLGIIIFKHTQLANNTDTDTLAGNAYHFLRQGELASHFSGKEWKILQHSRTKRKPGKMGFGWNETLVVQRSDR